MLKSLPPPSAHGADPIFFMTTLTVLVSPAHHVLEPVLADIIWLL
ncbi:hypothetical protein FLA105534_01511 [Flavobacterium bizetiae]|uniref:Uncharacterized protein n=1 Tax=Flavobacterium bizetiae TaxID=2704140 RepID=A0A6J4GI35_9FLAO|nr:hypothetical protein FLA105534_01511 [Flavobacterium bizetiae]CAD5342879.1 hypothetical protein FLA105535_02876 [Flavobacterium bizetiae]CAD5349294.1 hypothetical protein FLA105534_03278 [Flavobacterium bizetiae]